MQAKKSRRTGTRTKELPLWPEALEITAEAESSVNCTDRYVSANAGMGARLVMAEEMSGYILTDRATYLTFLPIAGLCNTQNTGAEYLWIDCPWVFRRFSAAAKFLDIMVEMYYCYNEEL